MGRKHCGKRRNCSLRAISSFPTVFSKYLYCRHVKNPGLVWERVNQATFSLFYLLRIINLKPLYSHSRERIITSLFRKLIKISKSYFKIDIKGISVQRYCISITPYLSAYRKFYSMLH